MKFPAFLILVLFAVSSLAAVPPVGTWEWASTEESPGLFTMPGDLGFTVQREFHSDLTYTEYRDELVFRTGIYRVDDVEFMGNIIAALYIDCGVTPEEVCAYGFGDNELQLYWGHNAGGWPSYPVEHLIPRDEVANNVQSWGHIKSLFR